MTLARLGIGAFTIADFDQFDFVNFNRQAGATVLTVGRDKIAVMEEMAMAINPELRIRRLDGGVNPQTLDDFLRDADLFVDGLDFFAISIRRQVFARCAELGIPALTAAPIGMGVAFIAFDPKGMTFEQYFRLEGRPEQEQYLRFLLGLTPRALHRRYLVDPTRVDLDRKTGPSTVAACQLCAGVTAVAAIKLLLGRGDVMPAPYNHQFDPYRGQYHTTRLAFGNAGPLQRLKIAIGRRLYARLPHDLSIADPPATARTVIEEILNLAHWAPSGDNAQPWTFRIIDDETVHVQIVHAPGNVYEYRNGEPTWLSAGMLIETMGIAATAWQRDMVWDCTDPDVPDLIRVRFPRSGVAQIGDPLLSFVTLRSVDRALYRRRRLSASEKAALSACIPPGLTIDWYEGIRDRLRVARLSAEATDIRLRCPEAFATHQRIIDWNRAISPSGIPAKALGLSAPTIRLMRWGMQRWDRMNLLNHLGGPLTASAETDILPGIFSAAHFVMRRAAAGTRTTDTPSDLIATGRALQRFWLTASRLGLAMQPATATLAFADYGERGTQFSSEPGLSARSEKSRTGVSRHAWCRCHGGRVHGPHRRTQFTAANLSLGASSVDRLDEFRQYHARVGVGEIKKADRISDASRLCYEPGVRGQPG